MNNYADYLALPFGVLQEARLLIEVDLKVQEMNARKRRK